jgi:hypothetical protein
MADNFTANAGAGGDTFASDDIGGVQYPISKIAFGALDSVTLASAANPLPVSVGTVPVTGPVTDAQLRATPIETALKATPADYWPGYSGTALSGPQDLHVDEGGALITRGAVTTDEGTFRVNFANTSLAVSLGAVTVSGDVVTGTGFLTSAAHYRDYFKLAADADTAYVQIDTIDSDTQMTLVSNYVGGSSGTGQRSLVFPLIGSGGSLAVASGALTITSGATNSAITGIKRFTDYAPLVFRAAVSASQRIANQEIHIGLEEDAAITRWFARFLMDGTTNTTIKCETGRNPTGTPSASETQTTTLTLPNGLTTATSLEYRIELLTESVRFYISNVLVAQHTRVIPSQHDEMTSHVEVRNGTGATTTNVVVDYMTGKNHNKIEIGVMSDAEQIVAAAVPLQAFSYSVAGVIAINTDLIVLDCLQLRSLFIQCTSMGTTGVVTVQWANDAAFTAPITATLLSEAGATSTTFNAAVLRVTNVLARYCRLRLTTATTAGTTTINVWGNQVPYVPVITTQPVSGTVTAGVTGYPAAAASADALANPTVTQIGAAALAFNGTTWDRTRGMSTALTTGDTGAKVATGNGATITNVGNKGVQILLNMGAVTGTTPTLVLKVQGSVDGGTLWYDIPGATTASITATGQYGILVYPGVATTAGVATTGTTATCSMAIPRSWRVVWTIGGTSPSFTITAVQYNYLPN